MARRSPRVQELRGKHELSYMCGLFSIIESCQGRPSHELISNGRPVNKHVIDNPRKLDQIASFDEECRKIQNEAGLGSVVVNARAKQNTVMRQRHAKMESELLHCLVKTQKRKKKSSQKVYQPSSCCLNNAASSIHQPPSTSAEVSIDKLTLGALLGPVCAQNHQEESKIISEYFQRNGHLGKYDQVDEINIKQIQMSAKYFVDQMFIDRNFICRERTSSGRKSFSDALEVLNSNKDLLMKLLPDCDYLHESRIKNLSPSQTEKGAAKSVLEAKFSYYEDLDASSSAKPGSTLTMQKGKTNKEKTNYQCQYSRKPNLAAQPSDKIVILKPARRNATRSGNVTCHCSSMQSRVPDAKITSFSFREMKKKLKHTFGVTRKEPSQFLMLGTSDKLSQDRSTLGVGDACICREVDIGNSLNASTIAKKNRKLLKEQDLNSKRGSDIACLTETVSKKLDLSDIRFSNKPEFDVILEAKRHLSTRLKNINSVEAVTSENSTKTLGRILSSPEHDFWTLSPRKHGQYSGSAQMRFSPYSTSPRVNESCSQVPNGREKACLSPLRSNSEVTSCDNPKKYDGTLQIMDAMRSSLIPNTDEAHNTDISTTGNIESNAELKIVGTEDIMRPELHMLEEVPHQLSRTDITRAMQITETIEAENEDEIDSFSENGMITSNVDDFPSTPLSIYQLDMADSIKYQEEHQSPASVLEPLFLDDADSPPNSKLQIVRQRLQPLRLDFEECSFVNSCTEEEDYLSQYVQLVMEASCLNWGQLSEIKSLPEELLHASLFDEVEFPPADCYYDPKLLFDHINEVLLGIYKCYFCSPPWLAFANQKLKSSPLVELVLDEIITESEFYLLPTTQGRTLDQLVSKDVAKCRSWLDVRLDMEQTVIEISQDVLEECILDILLELHL